MKIETNLVIAFLLVGLVFLMGAGFSFETQGFKKIDCQEINYSSPRMVDLVENKNLYIIINYQTKEPIKFPVGCE